MLFSVHIQRSSPHMSSHIHSAAQSSPHHGSLVPTFRAEHRLDFGVIGIAAETFGSPDDVPIMLIMGATASMVWWPDELCVTLARSGYYVTRYDHRDAGQSTTGSPGEVDYSAEDLTADLIGMMDALGLNTAHLVGMSHGGYILASRLKQLVAAGLLTRGDARRGQRALYSLTEAAIEVLPIMVALGNWGLAHRNGERRLRVRAELLRDGGPSLIEAMTDELREIHLGVPRPNPSTPLASHQLRAAYEATLIS